MLEAENAKESIIPLQLSGACWLTGYKLLTRIGSRKTRRRAFGRQMSCRRMRRWVGGVLEDGACFISDLGTRISSMFNRHSVEKETKRFLTGFME